MNEKIKYFGNFQAQTPSASQISELSLSTAFRERFSVPLVSVHSVSKTLSSTGFDCSWPIEIAVSRPDELHYLEFGIVPNKKTLVKELTAFRNLYGEDCEIVMRKPLPKTRETAISGFFILGVDFASFSFAAGEPIIFGVDNSKFFEDFGMDEGLAYRMSHSGSYIAFDNVISRKDPIFEKFLKHSKFFKSIPKTGKKRQSLRQEYLKGFESGIALGYPISTPYNLDTFSNERMAAFNLGNLVASGINDVFRRSGVANRPLLGLTGSIDWDMVSNKLSALSCCILEEPMRKRILDISIVHNAMIGKNPKDIDLDEHVSRVSGASGSYQSFNFAEDFFRFRKFYECTKVKADPIEGGGIKLSNLGEVSTNKEIKLTNGQFRVLGANTESVRIRLQLWDFEVKTLIQVNGSSEVLDSENYGKREVDISISASELQKIHEGGIEGYSEDISKLKYEGKSQAGTGAVYAALDLSDQGLVSKETGSLIVPMESLLAQSTGSGGGSTSSQFEGVLKIIEKLNKK